MGTGAARLSFAEDDVTQLRSFVETLCAESLPVAEPELVVCAGLVGAGKTTLRRRVYGRGYVQLDFLEALVAVTRAVGPHHPRFDDYVRAAPALALERAFAARNSLVIEVIDEGLLAPLVEPLRARGYRINVQRLAVDAEEGCRRHVRAIEEDPEYLSAYFTEEDTLAYLYRFLGVDPGVLAVHARAKAA